MNGEPKIKYMTFKTTLMIKHKKKKKSHQTSWIQNIQPIATVL